MATQVIPDFTFTPERYALHNARPDTIDFMWNAIRFTLPPVDAIGTKPAQFEDGSPIPGTMTVQDAYTVDSQGQVPTAGSTHNWRAKDAIMALLGVNPVTGTADSQLARNGVSMIPVVCTRARYEEVKKAGQERYTQSLITWAMETISGYEVARAKAKEAGVDSKPPGAEFYKAQAVLKMHNTSLEKQFGVEKDVLAEVAGDDEMEFKAYAYAFAEKMAAKAAEDAGVDKAKLVERLIEDPKVAANIRRKYSLRKKGYADPENPESRNAEQPPPSEGTA